MGSFSTHDDSNSWDTEAAHSLATNLPTSAATWFQKQDYSTFGSNFEDREPLQLYHFLIQEKINDLLLIAV
jgi:hypothetical protein